MNYQVSKLSLSGSSERIAGDPAVRPAAICFNEASVSHRLSSSQVYKRNEIPSFSTDIKVMLVSAELLNFLHVREACEPAGMGPIPCIDWC